MQEENEFSRKNFANRLKIIANMFFDGKTGKLAEHFGMTPQTFSKYLGGNRILGGEKLSQLTKLGVSVEWLLTGEGNALNPDILSPDKQWKRLFIIRLRTTVFHGTRRIAAQILGVDIETYQKWEIGIEPMPDGKIDQIYAMIQLYVRKEWWYEGKGEMFLETQRFENTFVREPGEKYRLTDDLHSLQEDIESCLDEMIILESKKDRTVFADMIKIRLREVGLFLRAGDGEN